MERKTVGVALDGALGSFDKCYSYFVPESLEDKAVSGCRVTVPFGSGNLKKHGIIVETGSQEENSKTKYILSVNDSEPVLNGEMLSLCLFMKERLFCTYFDAVNTVLPAGLKLKLEDFYEINPEFSSKDLLSGEERGIFEFISLNGRVSLKKIKTSFNEASETVKSLKTKGAVCVFKESKQNANDKTAKYVSLVSEDFEGIKLTPRQKEIAETLLAVGTVSVKELIYFTGVTVSVINALENKGIVKIFEKQIFRFPYKYKNTPVSKEITLNNEQQSAFDGLRAKLNSNKECVSLLYGVTGSGKTSVYMRLADEALKQNKGVIIMVPEIALTPQTVSLFGERYGRKIAVLHSAMSAGERMDEYNRLKSGEASVAIGTRSAVFAPVKNLGLIVMDEEQERTYKSEKSPRYHARDIAKFRANYNKCLLLLSSATPSLESYTYAKSGRYSLFEITGRYNGACLPNVCVADMRKELFEGNKSDISRLLASKIDERLQNNKQVIILLNRRGHNTHISCPNCGYVAVCGDCSVSLTYHSANKRLMCHYCGHSEEIPKKCPECQNEFLHFGGTGTQKLEEELSLLFPNAKILRLDADTTLAKDAYSEKLEAFKNREYDILLGTQMVAKGLDFPQVDLVGVIGADRAFYSDDYRGFERTFSLLTQVIGRAGRSGGNSEAVIQTGNTEDTVISLASKQDYKSFYEEEILTRKLMIYPPFCDICMVAAMCEDKDKASECAVSILKNIKELTGKGGEYEDIKVIILGPMPAAVVKVGGKYRYRMIIKCKNSRRFREMLKSAVDIKKKGNISVVIDINPETII